MSSRNTPHGPTGEPAGDQVGDWYEIRVQGRLDQRWAAWFDGLDLSRTDDGTTVLRGPVVDQTALHGLLHKLRDLGIPLLSVTRTNPGPGA
jgi:hypothetical protein